MKQVTKSELHEKITEHYRQACDMGIREVERLARKVLKQNKSLSQFCMAMGTYFFIDHNGDNVDTWQNIYSSYGCISNHAKKSFVELNEFISEWDALLKLTGEPMMFTATSEVRSRW